MNKPIKRHKVLQPLSREHHQGLLLCWKIRQGFRKEVAVDRMKSYVDWFKKEYLDPHFESEEKYVFPILGPEHDMIKRALAEHRRLRRLFNQKKQLVKALSLIEEELDAHIRFEERVVFNEVQKMATSEAYAEIEQHHKGIPFSDDNWDDHFWK